MMSFTRNYMSTEYQTYTYTEYYTETYRMSYWDSYSESYRYETYERQVAVTRTSTRAIQVSKTETDWVQTSTGAGMENDSTARASGYGTSNADIQAARVQAQKAAMIQIQHRINKLMQSQDDARNDPRYVRGGTGPFNNTNSRATWCNQSTFDIAQDTGIPENLYLDNETRWDTTANESITAMNNSVTNGSLSTVTGVRAQELANQGFTVIAARPNPSGSGHMSTVRPSNEPYDDSLGPVISNVGWYNGIDNASVYFGDNITYYYYPNQF